MLQFFSNSRQFLVEGADSLLILIHLLVLNILMLAKPPDHPFASDASVLKRLHTHQRLRSKQTISKRVNKKWDEI